LPFPVDDYTPFGYLANPYHRARSWTEVEAGLIRSTNEQVGFGWVEPTSRRPTREAAIVVVVRWGGRRYATRSDFGRLGYRSRYHSSRLFTYNWEMDDAEAEFSFALANRDTLCAQLRVLNRGARDHESEVYLVAVARSADGQWTAHAKSNGWHLLDDRGRVEYGFTRSPLTGQPIDADVISEVAGDLTPTDGVAVGFRWSVHLGPVASWSIGAGLSRGSSPAAAKSEMDRSTNIYSEKRAEDAAFYREAALPTGDWPSEWRRGWIYDLETTRACLYPAGGVFHDEWPSWMISWPRVVVAEGTLDVLRISYADPARALRLARTIFADALAANVPCIFQGGEPNMVAKDGAICGTSPAWCLPFYNLWLLYCRTLDRVWLLEIFPQLAAYVDFWLRERTDEAGWVVYKCTWEAGEDCTPRLDPAAEGDEVISRFVRPVELQATLSLSAAILARFATELGNQVAAQGWQAVANDYADRTQRLWDESTGRYRDWDKRSNGFLQSSSQPAYWQTDPVRFSALSLTPLVAGVASPAQRERLRTEIEQYDAAPWCLWPSWSYVVAESASTAGWYDFAAQFARRIVGRVYRTNDRRTLSEARRPTPGTAPEFWPLDLADFNGSDGYGWGATTTSLWVRQVFGFLDGTETAERSFKLAPGLPEEWLVPGRRYGFTGLPFRGARLDVAYDVGIRGLTAVVRVSPVARIAAYDEHNGELPVTYDASVGESRVRVNLGQATRVLVI
jgi:Trehalase